MKKHLQKIKQKVAPKPMTPQEKKIARWALLIVIAVIALWLFLMYYDFHFLYVDEEHSDTVTNYIYIPIMVVVIAVTLYMKSFGAMLSAIIFSWLFLRPVVEGCILLINANAGTRQDIVISGTVVETKYTGHNAMTMHYVIQTDDGSTVKLKVGRVKTTYEKSEHFKSTLKKGCLGILYKEFPKK